MSVSLFGRNKLVLFVFFMVPLLMGKSCGTGLTCEQDVVKKEMNLSALPLPNTQIIFSQNDEWNFVVIDSLNYTLEIKSSSGGFKVDFEYLKSNTNIQENKRYDDISLNTDSTCALDEKNEVFEVTVLEHTLKLVAIFKDGKQLGLDNEIMTKHPVDDSDFDLRRFDTTIIFRYKYNSNFSQITEYRIGYGANYLNKGFTFTTSK